MKLYRLKDEVERYFNDDLIGSTFTLEKWRDWKVSIEALEEVPKKGGLSIVDYCLSGDGVSHSLEKNSGEQFTEQERADIEFFLHYIGNKDKLNTLASDYIVDRESGDLFTDYLQKL